MTITVSDCIIYPLKSGQGFQPDKADVLPDGLSGDRGFMLVDADNRFLNQKKLPDLAKFSLITFAQFSPYKISDSLITVNIHNDTVNAACADDETNEALSKIFGRAVKLVEFHGSEKRLLDTLYSSPGDTTLFADAFPILITSQSSLDALAPHFKSSVTMDRFRPNIVLEGAPPFAEDIWKRIKIGNEVELEVVQNCARCAITTIDQKTGVKTGTEPLTTLNKLRKGDKSVYFGVYAIPRKLGTIRPGDTVEVLETRPLSADMSQAKINGLKL